MQIQSTSKKTFHFRLHPIAFFIILVTFILSNFGLHTIMKISLPCVLILCPIALSLVLAHLVPWFMRTHLPVTFDLSHTPTMWVCFGFSLLDTLHILHYLPAAFTQQAQQWIPLFWAHTSWLSCLLC